jgi:hypothetical protein
MALFALLALLIASLAGLLDGRWRSLVPIVPAIPAFAIVAGPVVGAVTALAVVGMGVGVRLRQVVAESR